MPTIAHHPRLFLSLFAVLVVAIAPASAAAHGKPALQSGVHIDPGSPAAKEYSIPLASARGVPAGNSSQGQLFGSGITKNGSGGSGGSSGGSGAATGTSGHHAHRSGSRHRHARAGGGTLATSGTLQAGAAGAAIPPAVKVIHPGSSSGVFWMILVALLVVALGLGAAYAFSRGRGRRVDARLS
jgi:hypothetical protein